MSHANMPRKDICAVRCGTAVYVPIKFPISMDMVRYLMMYIACLDVLIQ